MTRNTKQILIAVAAAVAVAALAYGGGRWQGHQRTEEVRAEFEQTRSDLQSTNQKLEDELQQVRSSLGACQKRADRLDARRRIHMALRELTALNFGYAQKHLTAAGNMLTEAAGKEKGLHELADKMQKTDIEPTKDLDESRDRLIRLAEQFDEVVPPK